MNPQRNRRSSRATAGKHRSWGTPRWRKQGGKPASYYQPHKRELEKMARR